MYTQTKTNSINKTSAFQQVTLGKEEPDIVAGQMWMTLCYCQMKMMIISRL